VSGAEAHRIEGEHALQPLQQIKNQKAEEAKCEQTSGVMSPALIGIFFDTAKNVAEFFYGPENRVQKRPLACENLRHERAHRLGEGENQDEKDSDLQHSIGYHVGLESLRFKEREDQVQEEEKRGYAS
jgi:hypothetical protein